MSAPWPFVENACYPVRLENCVRPLIDGGPAFRRIIEAVEAARHSVYVIVAFCHRAFEFPDGRGSVFDLLDRATVRGIDVRVLFWRTNAATEETRATCFDGTPGQRTMLAERGTVFSIRWDRADEQVGCHHQKSWLIDAGQPGETAFIGGINMNPSQVAEPGHRAGGHHDAYIEVAGPAASDVHRNFVERWNAASDKRRADGIWGKCGGEDMVPPGHDSPACGSSVVQIQRTLHRRGEKDILDQYLAAIDAAEQTIHIETQALLESAVIERLDAALRRSVRVGVVLPAEPEAGLRRLREHPQIRPIFDALGALDAHDHFTLIGLASRPGGDRAQPRKATYVHAKLMTVDDRFLTVGSCNLHLWSLHRQTEMNASVLDPAVARALRCELLDEHLELDTSGVDGDEAAKLLSEVARRNAMTGFDGHWQGNVLALDARRYGA
jgi:cardiolipin synthase A/B